MIWRFDEGQRLRYGLNWNRSRATTLSLLLLWRGWSHYYSIGFRLRSPGLTPPGLSERWIWRPLRRGCMRCNAYDGVLCVTHARRASPRNSEC